MNDHHAEVARLLSAIEEAEPPRALRGRALAQAEAAWERPPAADRWRRAWESHPLRIAWAGAVVVLIAANVALRSGSHLGPRREPPSTSLREEFQRSELQAIVELPRLRLEYLGGDTSPVGPTSPRNPGFTQKHRDSEDKS